LVPVIGSRDTAPAVLVEDVSKTFRMPQERVHTLKERALHPFRRSRFDRLEALKDVSFAVQPGEFFGIVGRNGSGKSTLLKCLAGIYRADGGSIYVNGRLSTFIELGVGFNPDLDARDNVAINAIMLGLSPKEAHERFERVIEFAELEDFVDLKLKNYSSGMHVRLAFSVMIQVDADILLIDEVLAVGDVAFQQKCFDVFNRIRDERRTVLFVTHDMASVKRFCDRALLLDRGEMRLLADPDRVAQHYIELNFGRDSLDREYGEELERLGDQSAQIVEAWFEDEHGRRQSALPQGRPCAFRMRVRFNHESEHPGVAVLFENDRHHPLFATSTDTLGGETGRYRSGEEAVFSVRFDNAFTPGRVYASPWVIHSGGADLMDRRPRIASIVVTGTHHSGGLVDLPHDVSLERVGAAESEALA
jgi:ABC-type polysaccharide/polyol phosphate transport system ATPase subunit